MVVEQITSASGAPRDFIMNQILANAIEARDVGVWSPPGQLPPRRFAK
jgi:hypothetical protein